MGRVLSTGRVTAVAAIGAGVAISLGSPAAAEPRSPKPSPAPTAQDHSDRHQDKPHKGRQKPEKSRPPHETKRPTPSPVATSATVIARGSVVPLGSFARPAPSSRTQGPVVPSGVRRTTISGTSVPAAVLRPAVPARRVIPVVRTFVTRSVRGPEFPVSLVTVVTLFLLVQHRIDRRDPKLSALPGTGDLRFRPYSGSSG